jgi:5-methylcytosine-specific restriction endonuclease McrBC GTP-binding regulatory subunit McrB
LKECKYKNGEYDEASKKYIFIIDEINRGEISKIFGELFFSIDPGYRGIKGGVKTQYANMHNNPNENFYVPENVYIIGTMNDIDRSVESFDFAMRRRFTWVEITAKESQSMFDPTQSWTTAIKKMDAINDVIWKDKDNHIEGLNSSYHIGGAYFLKLKIYNGVFTKLWDYHLEPLLKEYLRGMPDADEKLGNLKTAYENNGQ